MNKGFSSVKQFFISRKDYFLSMGVIFVMFQILLIINGCFPYGQNSVLMSDSYSQVGAFLQYVIKIFKGEASLFYTNQIGAGVEIIPTLFYMLLNPFYLIVLPFGINNVYYVMNFVVMLMFFFNATIFLWFVKKYFKTIKKWSQILLSVMFAFCPFVVANFFFSTWIIFPALTLLLIDGFLRLLNDGKIARFSLILIWFVVNCLSIGVSTNIVLLVIFSAFIFFTKNKEEQKPAFVKLFVAYLISACVSVIILFPSIVGLLQTSRAGSLFFELFRTPKANQTFDRFAFAFCDGILILFMIFYLVKCDKKSGKNKFYLFAIILLTLINVSGQSIALLCGGTYNAFHFRFYFLNEVLIFVLALEFFAGNFQFEHSEQKNIPIYKIIYFALMFIYVLCLVWWGVINFIKFGVGIKNVVIVGDIMKVATIVFLVLMVISLFIYFSHRFGVISKRIFNFSLVFFMCASLLVNFVSLSCKTYTKSNNIKSVTQMLDFNDKFKVHKSADLETTFNACNFGLRANSYFSSFVSNETLNSFKSIGLRTSVSASTNEAGTLISDALVGNKYIITEVEQTRPYYKLVEFVDEKYYIYENTLATTGAVFIDENYEINSELSVYENLENLKTSMGVSGTLFEDFEFQLEEVEVEEAYSKGAYKISFKANSDGIVYIDRFLMHPDNAEYIAKCNELFGEGKWHNAIYDQEINDVCFVEKGQEVEFYINLMGEFNEEDKGEFNLKFMNYEVAELVCKKLQQNQVKIEYNKKGYTLKFDGQTEGRLVVFHNNLKGMNYASNQGTIDATKAFVGFTGLKITSGMTELVAKYSYPNAKLWLLVSLAIIAMIVVIILVYKKTEFKFMQKVMRPAFLVASCGILLVFVVFGIFLTIFRTFI